MGIEAVKSSAAAYQGSGTAAEVKLDTVAKTDNPKVSNVPENLSVQTAPKDSVAESNEEAEMVGGKTQEKNNKLIRKAVEEINRNYGNTEAIFGIHDETNRVTIKIVNKETKDVIREVPAEKTLDMIAKVWELAGFMVDEKR